MLWRCYACEETRGVDTIIAKRNDEFLVTWLDSADWHASWVPRSRLDELSKLKLKHFERKNPVPQNGTSEVSNGWGSDDAAHLEELRTYGLRLVPHRVIQAEAHRDVEAGPDRTLYLVKWSQKGYDKLTWELGGDAEIAARKEIAAYRRREHRKTKGLGAAAAVDEDDEIKEETGDTTDDEGPATRRQSGLQPFAEQPRWLSGGSLHGYQLDGVNWLRAKWHRRENVILADEMGLGKTIMSTGLLGSVAIEASSRPALVVAPLSTLDNWEREVTKWCPRLNVFILHGNQNARKSVKDYELVRDCNDDAAFDVVITSYEMVAAERAALSKFRWTTLIVDEGHRLKSGDSSKLFQELTKLQTTHRVLLTGTPLQNSLTELYHLILFIDPNLYNKLQSRGDQQQKSEEVEEDTAPTATTETQPAETPTTEQPSTQAPLFGANDDDAKLLEELRTMLQGRMLRRTKADVLNDGALPTKQEQIVRVELTKQQKSLYRQVLTKEYMSLAKCDDDNKTTDENKEDSEPTTKRKRQSVDLTQRASSSAPRLQNIVMQLRKVCNHTILMDPDVVAAAATAEELRNVETEEDSVTVDPSDPAAHLLRGAGKLALLDRMLEKWKAGGHRVLIFSQMTTMLDVLCEYFDVRRYEYLRLDGSTNSRDRQARVDEFNAPGSSKFVFLLSTRAGGLGINLATADTVVIYDADWNPHNDLQALSRAHRLGQQNKVMIYRLVSRDSVEERILQVAKKKLLLEHVVVGKTRSNKKDAALSKAELDDVLRYGAQDLFATKQKNSGRIYWDAAALENLLDRTKADEDDADKRGSKSGLGKLMDSFKVAETSFLDDKKAVDADEEEKKEEPTIEEEGETSLPEVKSFQWSELLEERFQKERDAELARHGKGKRRTRNGAVDYEVFADVVGDDKDDDEDYVPTSHSPTANQSTSSNSPTNGPTTLTTTKLRGRVTLLKQVASRLLAHGIVFAEEDWQWTHDVLRVPACKDAAETRELCLEVLELCLKKDPPFWVDPSKVLPRIGFFALATRALQKPSFFARCGLVHAEGDPWTFNDDKKLLAAVCCCGFSHWDRMLQMDHRFGIEKPMESSVDFRYRNQPKPKRYQSSFLKDRTKLLETALITAYCAEQNAKRHNDIDEENGHHHHLESSVSSQFFSAAQLEDPQSIGAVMARVEEWLRVNDNGHPGPRKKRKREKCSEQLTAYQEEVSTMVAAANTLCSDFEGRGKRVLDRLLWGREHSNVAAAIAAHDTRMYLGAKKCGALSTHASQAMVILGNTSYQATTTQGNPWGRLDTINQTLGNIDAVTAAAAEARQHVQKLEAERIDLEKVAVQRLLDDDGSALPSNIHLANSEAAWERRAWRHDDSLIRHRAALVSKAVQRVRDRYPDLPPSLVVANAVAPAPTVNLLLSPDAQSPCGAPMVIDLTMDSNGPS